MMRIHNPLDLQIPDTPFSDNPVLESRQYNAGFSWLYLNDVLVLAAIKPQTK